MDLFEPGQRAKLLEELLNLTELGVIEWSAVQTWGRTDKYEAKTKLHKFLLGSEDGDGEPPFYLNVSDKPYSDEVLTTIETDAKNYGEGPSTWSDDGDNEYQIADLLTRLYRRARRRATNFDAAVASIFDELKRLRPSDDLPF